MAPMNTFRKQQRNMENMTLSDALRWCVEHAMTIEFGQWPDGHPRIQVWTGSVSDGQAQLIVQAAKPGFSSREAAFIAAVVLAAIDDEQPLDFSLPGKETALGEEEPTKRITGYLVECRAPQIAHGDFWEEYHRRRQALFGAFPGDYWNRYDLSGVASLSAEQETLLAAYRDAGGVGYARPVYEGQRIATFATDPGVWYYAIEDAAWPSLTAQQ
jgi:hypothetical protein